MPDLPDDGPVVPIDPRDFMTEETTQRVVFRQRDGSATLVTLATPLPSRLTWFATASPLLVRGRTYVLVIDADGRLEYREG